MLNTIANALMALAAALAVGCASPGNHVEKQPIIGTAQVYDADGNAVYDADGNPVTQQIALADHVTFDLRGFAGEGVIYDNFQKNFITLSTKDEGIEDFQFDAKWDETTGELTSINASIGRKDANASDPTIAAWNGYGEAVRSTIGDEGLGQLLGTLIQNAIRGGP